MRRTVMALAAVAAVTLAGCSPTPSTPSEEVSAALEAIAAASSPNLIDIGITEWSDRRTVSARVFHDNRATLFEYRGGEVHSDEHSHEEFRMGLPAAPADWDVEQLLAVHPEPCPPGLPKQMTAQRVQHGTVMQVACRWENQISVLNGHEYQSLEDWSSPQALRTMLGEVPDLAGDDVQALRWHLDRVFRKRAFTIKGGAGEAPDGRPCAGFVTRFFEPVFGKYISYADCQRPGSDDPDSPPFRVADIDPDALSEAMHAAAELSGYPLDDAARVVLRTTPLPEGTQPLDPYLYMEWNQQGKSQRDEAQYALDIDTGAVLHRHVIRDGEPVDD